jgi:hypothetical protein
MVTRNICGRRGAVSPTRPTSGSPPLGQQVWQGTGTTDRQFPLGRIRRRVYILVSPGSEAAFARGFALWRAGDGTVPRSYGRGPFASRQRCRYSKRTHPPGRTDTVAFCRLERQSQERTQPENYCSSITSVVPSPSGTSTVPSGRGAQEPARPLPPMATPAGSFAAPS